MVILTQVLAGELWKSTIQALIRKRQIFEAYHGRGVNHFNIECARFLFFQRDFYFRRTRFLISYGDFKRFLTSDLPLDYINGERRFGYVGKFLLSGNFSSFVLNQEKAVSRACKTNIWTTDFIKKPEDLWL